MIRPGNKILIAGDSWACGEWGVVNNERRHGITHPGLEQYLTDYGCEVYNVGLGGGCNKGSVNNIISSLTSLSPDKIFWFQTDPMRDLRPYYTDSFPKSVNEMLNCQQELLKKTYEDLNNIGCNIYCLGGVTKLSSSIISYSNLIPVIESIAEFFGSESIDIWVSEWIHHENLCSTELIEEVYSIPDPKTILPQNWFHPDGYHPNRFAHQKIFEHILNFKEPC
jgi:hypothetical protein